MEDGDLRDHALFHPGRPDGYGDLHLGRAGRHVAPLGGTFVALAGGVDGFLPDRETERPPSEGTPVVVRAIRSALGGKGPRLSARGCDAPPDRDAREGPPRLLRRGPSPLDALLARWPEAPVVVPTPALAAGLAPRAVRIDARPDRAFEAACQALRDGDVALPGGARATIHPTPALVAIDLDTASAPAAASGRPAALLGVNRAALPRLLHEIRLRDLSGAILIDLAGMQARKRALLAPDMAAGLAPDPLGPRFLGFTALGLAEIVRPRRRPALHERLAGAAGRALDAAEALVAETLAAAARRGAALALEAGPALIHAIEADAVLRDDLARATGHPLILRATPGLGAGWRIADAREDETR